MAARVFSVDELATLIAAHLVEISPQSAVSLARTCRVLEVPALSALWETQDSIRSLITRVLPEDVWCYDPRHRDELYPIVSNLFRLRSYPLTNPTRPAVDTATYYGGVE